MAKQNNRIEDFPISFSLQSCLKERPWSGTVVRSKPNLSFFFEKKIFLAYCSRGRIHNVGVSEHSPGMELYKESSECLLEYSKENEHDLSLLKKQGIVLGKMFWGSFQV